MSFREIGTIKEVLFDKFQENVLMYFSTNYICQFTGFDFYFLVKNYKNKMESNIMKIKNLTTNKVELDFNFMEFSDGIYDVPNNRFFNKKLTDFNNFKNTSKYYYKSYERTRKVDPQIWIDGVCNALGIKGNPLENEDFLRICFFIAESFQNQDGKKRRFLYIVGKTNTGKTTYITKFFSNYFGENNIGYVVNASNFKFQGLVDKPIIILDEFRYSPSFSGDFLKILGGEPLLTSEKYQKKHAIILNSKGIILSNEFIKDKNIEIQNALLERLHLIEFKNKFKKTDVNINSMLLNLEPNIVLFCNKLYFKKNNKKQREISLKSKEINAIDTIDIIEI